MNFSEFTDDIPELKNPFWIREQAYAIIARMNDPDIKILIAKHGSKKYFPYVHFILDEEFRQFSEECGSLLGKIINGDFQDERNHKILELILEKIEQIHNGQISKFDGEVEIGQELHKLFPTKKRSNR